VAQKKKLTRETNTQQPIDAFQSAGSERLENFGKKLEGKGKPILYGLLALVAIAALAGIFYNYTRRSAAAAQTSLGKAIEISEAQVSASPIPNNPAPTFTTEKERSEKAIAAFQEVANKYGSPYKDKALYFIAVNRLKLDRGAGIQELEALAKSGDREVATLSKFALAEAKAAEGKFDEAAAGYNDLAQAKTGIISDDTINFALASIYEKQGKKQEAADIYFNLAKAGREAKDAEGQPIALSLTAREAARKLEKLDSARFAQLPEEPAPASMGGFGM
jgi:hypothetical protein